MQEVESILKSAGDEAPQIINDDFSQDCILQSCTRAYGNAFYYACCNNRLQIIELMIAYGADIYSTGYCGETCLHAAARNNFAEAARILIKHGCDVHATDDQGRYAIHCTGGTVYNTTNTIKFLLEEAGKREDVNLRDFSGRTPLHLATSAGNGDAASVLIQYGADVNAVTNEGNTPLHCARNSTIYQLLKDKGADCNIQNKHGFTPQVKD